MSNSYITYTKDMHHVDTQNHEIKNNYMRKKQLFLHIIAHAKAHNFPLHINLVENKKTVSGYIGKPIYTMFHTCKDFIHTIHLIHPFHKCTPSAMNIQTRLYYINSCIHQLAHYTWHYQAPHDTYTQIGYMVYDATKPRYIHYIKPENHEPIALRTNVRAKMDWYDERDVPDMYHVLLECADYIKKGLPRNGTRGTNGVYTLNKAYKDTYNETHLNTLYTFMQRIGFIENAH